MNIQYAQCYFWGGNHQLGMNDKWPELSRRIQAYGGITMRVTAKGRYALAAMIHLGQQKEGECVPIIHISEKLELSKIYLQKVKMID